MVADRGDGPDVSFCSYVGKVLSAGAVLQSSRCFIVNNAPTYGTWFSMAMPLHVVGLVTIHSPTTGECIELSNYYISIVIVEYLVP